MRTSFAAYIAGGWRHPVGVCVNETAAEPLAFSRVDVNAVGYSHIVAVHLVQPALLLFHSLSGSFVSLIVAFLFARPLGQRMHLL